LGLWRVIFALSRGEDQWASLPSPGRGWRTFDLELLDAFAMTLSAGASMGISEATDAGPWTEKE
jgi:hypothetical protein